MVAERTPADRSAEAGGRASDDKYVEPAHVETSLDAILWAFRHFEDVDWPEGEKRNCVPYLDEHGFHIDHPSRPFGPGPRRVHPDGYTLDPPGLSWDGTQWIGPDGKPIDESQLPE